MLNCYWKWGLAVVISGGLMSGCSSAPPPGGVAGRAALPRQAESDELPLEKAAQAHAHFGAGVVHEMNGQSGAALDEYYQAARLDCGNEGLVLDVSRRLLQARKLDKALDLAGLSAARARASGLVYARLGLIYAELGKTEQAIAADRTAIKRSPGVLAGYRNLFLAYLQGKRSPEALGVLQEAGRQPSTDPEFLMGLSELYVNLGAQVPSQKETAHAKAMELLNRVVRTNPQAAAVRLLLADSFNQLGDTARAAQLYLDLLKRLPDAPLLRERIHEKLMYIYLRASDHKHAAEQLEGILQEDPTNPAAYYYLGRIAFDEKKWERAAECFGKTILLSPDFEQAYYDLASSQLNFKQPRPALATLDQARQKFGRDSQNFVLEFLTGRAYSRDKEYARALEVLHPRRGHRAEQGSQAARSILLLRGRRDL